MKYAVTSIHDSIELASRCRSGHCPVKFTPFLCPVAHCWPGDARCEEVTASQWDGIGVAGTFTESDLARQDVRFNLARKAKVEELLASCKESDIINRMSLQGELLNIAEELSRLAKDCPKDYEAVVGRIE